MNSLIKIRVKPTVELVKKFTGVAQGWYAARNSLENQLLERPLWRAMQKWISMGHSGLSPVALAGLAGLSLPDTFRQLHEEGGTNVGLCYDTVLPVFGFDSYNAKKKGIAEYYTAEILNWCDESGEYERQDDKNRCPCPECQAKPKPKKKAMTLKEQLKIGYPLSWKQYSDIFKDKPIPADKARKFDPFKRGCGLSVDEWDQLLGAVWLEDHKGGKVVKNVEAA